MARPERMNTNRKPLTGSPLTCRMKVRSETPTAPPTLLNIPRSPTIVPTLLGMSSMHALLVAGSAMPRPMPENRIRDERISTGLNQESHDVP